LSLLTDRLQSPAPLPYAGHCFPQLLIRDVEIALRLLDVRVTQHQLNRTDVDAVGQEAAGAFVPQVVPVQVDLAELLPITIGP
jgi:hypothetical protein